MICVKCVVEKWKNGIKVFTNVQSVAIWLMIQSMKMIKEIIMRLSDKELKKLPNDCIPFNSSGAVIINKDLLKDLVDELIKLRNKKE